MDSGFARLGCGARGSATGRRDAGVAGEAQTRAGLPLQPLRGGRVDCLRPSGTTVDPTFCL